MNYIHLICLNNALGNLAISLGFSALYFHNALSKRATNLGFSSSHFQNFYNPGIFGGIEPDMEFVVPQPKPKSPSGAAGATAITEIDELQLVRQLLAELCESYQNSNITELEKKAAVGEAIHILMEGLKKEEPNLKARLLRATYGYNSFHLQRYLSFQSNNFVEMTLDELREILAQKLEHEM
ncbi:hypothetical protein H6G36_24215 [Anabaena minutissima FACHB-250]|nr:hypothetical protein [Anabaena minutissima FACHB-250]